MLDNIKNITNKIFWILVFLFMLYQQRIHSQIPTVNKVNKKYDVWQIDRINHNWPKRKRDFRPQLFYLFFSRYKKRNHNNWRQHIPIETTSNYVVRPQVETFRDTMSGLLKSKSLEYAFQKVSIGWYLHYQKKILDKRNQIRKEIDVLSDKGGPTWYVKNEFVKINQYVDGIKNSLMDDTEKQKGFSQSLIQYHRLLHSINARKSLVDLKNQNNSLIDKERIQTYLKTAETFSQKIKNITW